MTKLKLENSNHSVEIMTLKHDNRKQNAELSKLKYENSNQSADILKLKLENRNQSAEMTKLKHGNRNQNAELTKIKYENSNQSAETTKLKLENNDKSAEIAKIKLENSNQSAKIAKLDACATPRVAFMATISKGMTVRSNKPVIYDKIITNTDGGYNHVTGQFKVTTPGVYYFSINAQSYTDSVCLRLQINSVKITSLMAYGTSKNRFESGSTSAVVLVKVNDIVKVLVDSGCGSSTLYQKSFQYSLAFQSNVFSGYLLR